MKFTFVSQSKESAEKFSAHIKSERKLDSSVTEKDGKFHVEYSIADCCYDQPKTGECCTPTPSYDDLSRMASYIFKEMQYQMNWLWAEISYLRNSFYQHVDNGHLPPIKGAEKMEKALTALGIGGDYEVKKPVIYSSASTGKGILLDLPEIKK